jgi:AcrR family transcriptional regulator
MAGRPDDAMAGRPDDAMVTGRAEQVQATREVIMTAAERLFAEHGVAAVSARQIGEAAGQGNTAAVGYHFGTKTGLVQAIIRKHTADIERIRTRMAAEATGSGELRDWVSCLVRPSTDHLASLGAPTWFARFAVQVMADPALRPLLVEQTYASPALGQSLKGIDGCLSGLPATVRAERDDMVLALIVDVIGRHERLLADAAGEPGAPDPRANWHCTATVLTDAIVGLYQAPVTPPGQAPQPPMREAPQPEEGTGKRNR